MKWSKIAKKKLVNNERVPYFAIEIIDYLHMVELILAIVQYTLIFDATINRVRPVKKIRYQKRAYTA